MHDCHTIKTFDQTNHQNCGSTLSLSAISPLSYGKDAREGPAQVCPCVWPWASRTPLPKPQTVLGRAPSKVGALAPLVLRDRPCMHDFHKIFGFTHILIYKGWPIADD